MAADAKRLEEGFGQTTVSVERKGGEIDAEHDKQDNGTLVEQNAEEKGEDQQLYVKQKSKRIATLDAFRGLTIVVSCLKSRL